MFTPDLDLKVVTRCTQFSIQDKTGRDTGDGTKWSGGAGLDPSDLTSAIVQIINPLGVANDEVDVLSQIVANVTGAFRDFWFNDVTGTSEDGLHNIVYKLRLVILPLQHFPIMGLLFLVLFALQQHLMVLLPECM